MEQPNLFGEDSSLYLRTEYIGKVTANGGLTKNNPRRWTDGEIKWALLLKDRGYNNKQIATYLYREYISVAIKMKRLSKQDGKSYNGAHREDKYYYNGLFLEQIAPNSVLDLFSGEVSYYTGKVRELQTNDINKRFASTYSEKAEKLVCKLYYDSNRYDLIDIDPFGSAYDCFDLSIKMAKKGVIITLGELGHKRWKRLDFVRRYYNIHRLEDFTTNNLISEIVRIGLRNKKKLTPVFIREYRFISRVYFSVTPIKIMEQWE